MLYITVRDDDLCDWLLERWQSTENFSVPLGSEKQRFLYSSSIMMNVNDFTTLSILIQIEASCGAINGRFKRVQIDHRKD